MMATCGNNISAEIAQLRDSFFSSEGEQEFLSQLLESPSNRLAVARFSNIPAEKLYKTALDLIENAEAGAFTDEQMNNVEEMLAITLASIDDAHPEMILER